MTRDGLEGDDLRDTYTDALAAVIEAKREEKPLPEAPEPEEPGKVLDLMAALQESVAKAQASRGETEADIHDLPAEKTRAKETTKKAAGRNPRSA